VGSHGHPPHPHACATQRFSGRESPSTTAFFPFPVSVSSKRLSLQITVALLFPLPPCSCQAPSGPPPSIDTASSVGHHRAEPPSPPPRRVASTVGPRCRLLTRCPVSTTLVLTAPTEPPHGHRRTAGELTAVRAAVTVTARMCYAGTPTRPIAGPLAFWATQPARSP
jgi:hypothetical protein